MLRYLVLILFFFGSVVFCDFFYDTKNGQHYINNDTSFSIKSVDNSKYLEKIEVSIDDKDFEPYTGKLHFDKEGLHNIRFRAVDPVLNWSPIQTFRFYVDLTSPKSQSSWEGAQHLNGNETYIHPSTKLVINAQDNLAGIKKIYWKKDDKTDFQEFSGLESFEKPGSYKLQIYAVDKTGNKAHTLQRKSLRCSRKGISGSMILSGARICPIRNGFVFMK